MFEPNIATEIREKIDAVFPDGRIVPAHTEREHFYQDTEDGEVYASVTTKLGILSRPIYKQLAANTAAEFIREAMLKNPNPEPEEFSTMFEEAKVEHVRKLKLAGSHGTFGHDFIDRYVTDWIEKGERKPDINEFREEGMSNEGVCVGLGAMKFFEDYTLFPIASEMFVISKKRKYAGTLDSLFFVGHVYSPEGKTPRRGTDACVGKEHLWANKGKRHVGCLKCNREEQLELALIDWKSSNQITSQYEYACQIALYSAALKEMFGLTCQKHWIVQLDKYEPKYTIGDIPDIKKALKAGLAVATISDYARNGETVVPLIKKQRITLQT